MTNNSAVLHTILTILLIVITKCTRLQNYATKTFTFTPHIQNLTNQTKPANIPTINQNNDDKLAWKNSC